MLHSRIFRSFHSTSFLVKSIKETDTVTHAVVSTFDLFSIGIGPSSSHTVGPMRAAKIFIGEIAESGLLDKVSRIRIDLYGSLSLTGDGHGTPPALIMGLQGESPETVQATTINQRTQDIIKSKSILLSGIRKIGFDIKRDLIYNGIPNLNAPLCKIKEDDNPADGHPNGMRFMVFDNNGDLLRMKKYYSIGGGFVIPEINDSEHGENVFYKKTFSSGEESDPNNHAEETNTDISSLRIKQDDLSDALAFRNGQHLLEICHQQNMSIAQVVFQNELLWRPDPTEIQTGLLNIWNAMNHSIQNGVFASAEYLPGDLKVKRRAPALYRKLMASIVVESGIKADPLRERINALRGMDIAPKSITSQNKQRIVDKIIPASSSIPGLKRRLPALDWISLYAISVNEENACGGRVVTAPTNGAAGVIPAVLKYYLEFVSESPPHKQTAEIMEFLLTCSAIGMLFKRGSSISAAEVGCQGEVGVACAMAAGGLAAVMGGTPEQIENASEIGIEHNLGLTCDPIGGLVQIPCIERNALGAVKAVTAAQLSLQGDGIHVQERVTLDQAIETMRQTGLDMQSKYKETSLGGLAVNVPVC